MFKTVSAILIFFIFGLRAYTQPPIPKVDSLRIESLKKQLDFLKDSARVDCLNDISREYIIVINSLSWDHWDKRDSAILYSKKANEEATKINYKTGQAYSLIDLSRVFLLFKKDTIRSENYLQQAFSIAQQLHSDKIAGWAYLAKAKKSNLQTDTTQITPLKTALLLFQKSGDKEGEAEAAKILCDVYYTNWKLEEAFEYAELSLAAAKVKRIHNITYGQNLVISSLGYIGLIYEEVGDLESAMQSSVNARQYAQENNNKDGGMEIKIGALFIKLKKYDSALYYINQRFILLPGDPWNYLFLGEVYFATKNYNKALELFLKAESGIKKIYPDVVYTRPMLFVGKTYEALGAFSKALPYAQNFIIHTRNWRQINYTIDGYELMTKVLHGLHQDDSAFFYLQAHARLKDSLANKYFLWRLNYKLASYKKAAEDEKKANQIQILTQNDKIKQQQLKQQTLIRNFLVLALLSVIGIGTFIFRNLSLRRKNEKLEGERIENELKLRQLQSDESNAKLQHQAAELEMQALRAQMNPHFIFNCLSSINKYIIKNETEAASDYLTRFSRLIRMVLINSQKTLITLEEELNMLRLYLDMERLRFNNIFDYNIIFTNAIEPATVFIPPLLLQPFCENAIWHGLMHKEGHGNLDIALTIQDDILFCSISDNGVGREKATELKSKSAERQKSLGLKITNNRLALLNQGAQEDSYYKMNDIIDEEGKIGGTRVDIKIHYNELV